jgi:hypothetical protein
MVTCRDPSDNFAECDFLLTVAGARAGEPGNGSENGSKDMPEPIPEPTPDPTTGTNPVVTATIVVNELMPNPIGRDRGNETTELYNCGNEPVDIGGWVIKNEDGDAQGSTEGKSWQRRTDGLDTNSDGDWTERKDTFGVAA